MASHNTLFAEVQRSGSTEEIPVLPEVFETAPKTTKSAELPTIEPSQGAPELKTSRDTKIDVNAENLPPTQEEVELPVLPEVCETAPKATASADLQIHEPSERAAELSKSARVPDFDINAEEQPFVEEDVDLPPLQEVYGIAPKATASVELQITEPSEGTPEQSATSEDTKLDVNADNLSPVEEDVAGFNAAAEQAMQILRSAVRPYAPLDRRPWKQNFMGIDLVNHDGAEKPFSDVGVILMAAQLVKTWEKVVANDLKAKITVVGQSPQPTSRMATSITPVKKAQQQIEATLPHKHLSQPIAHAWKLPKKQRDFEKHVVIGGGLLFIKENYLRRLELENLVYRQHLHELEEGVFRKVLKELSKITRKKPVQANLKAKAATKTSSQVMKPKAKGTKRGSDEVEGSALVKRPKIGPHHLRGADVSDAIVISED